MNKYQVNCMKNPYSIAVIGCVLILAIGLTAGCTGTTVTHPTPSPVGGSPTTIATSSVASAPTPSVSSAISAPAVPTLFLNSTSNGKIIMVPAGERVLVRLSENPTTGYLWNATASKGLAIIKDSSIGPDTALVGAPGYHEWILSPRTIDTYTFRAVSLRPWEGAKATDETFSLVIQVTKD